MSKLNYIYDWNNRLQKEVKKGLLICENCEVNKELQIHHKNRERKDNRLINLMILCKICHKKEHKKTIITPIKSKSNFCMRCHETKLGYVVWGEFLCYDCQRELNEV